MSEEYNYCYYCGKACDIIVDGQPRDNFAYCGRCMEDEKIEEEELTEEEGDY